MSSYVILEFDTTPPEIEIYAPSYTTTELFNEITIMSNESLSDYQEVYIVDSNGDRHDYTFNRENEKEYVGIVKFSLFPNGISTIYVRMMDDVGNLSNIVTKSFEIKESLTILTLDISNRQANINIDDKSRNIENNDRSMNVEISANDRGVKDGNS